MKARQEADKIVQDKKDFLKHMREKIDSLNENDAQAYIRASIEISRIEKELKILERFYEKMGWS